MSGDQLRPVNADAITDYWLHFYAVRVCTLCGGHGWIDSRGVKATKAGETGRLNYCICPNGQGLRSIGANIPISDQAELTRSPGQHNWLLVAQTLRNAFEPLTNGFKYSTEVCNLARAAITASGLPLTAPKCECDRPSALDCYRGTAHKVCVCTCHPENRERP